MGRGGQREREQPARAGGRPPAPARTCDGTRTGGAPARRPDRRGAVRAHCATAAGRYASRARGAGRQASFASAGAGGTCRGEPRSRECPPTGAPAPASPDHSGAGPSRPRGAAERTGDVGRAVPGWQAPLAHAATRAGSGPAPHRTALRRSGRSRPADHGASNQRPLTSPRRCSRAGRADDRSINAARSGRPRRSRSRDARPCGAVRDRAAHSAPLAHARGPGRLPATAGSRHREPGAPRSRRASGGGSSGRDGHAAQRASGDGTAGPGEAPAGGQGDNSDRASATGREPRQPPTAGAGCAPAADAGHALATRPVPPRPRCRARPPGSRNPHTRRATCRGPPERVGLTDPAGGQPPSACCHRTAGSAQRSDCRRHSRGARRHPLRAARDARDGAGQGRTCGA